MMKLIGGFRQFYDRVYSPQRRRYEERAKGQSPRALFISCSDSRMAPEAITQSDPGEIFVLRNAGNLVPPFGAVHGGEAATLEYAIGGLEIQNVVVCGHSYCGAMRALLEPETLEDLPETRRWLQHAEATRRVARTRFGKYDFETRWILTVEQNVLVQLENLRTHPCVADAMASGQLHLYGWVFDLLGGRIRNFDPAAGQFTEIPLGDEPFEPPTAISKPVSLARPGADGLKLAKV